MKNTAISVSIIPSAELLNALTVVGVEVLGVKDSNVRIGLVTDTTSGLTDLRIVTQYSNSSTLLKAPRVIEYEHPLHVGAIDDGGDDDHPVIE